MRILSLLFLSCWLPLSVSRSAAAGGGAHRIRPWGVESPRGGSSKSGGNNDFNFDIDSFGSLANAAATVFTKDVAPVLKRESQNALKYGKAFLEQQKKNAAERKKVYREQAGDLGATASTIADPVRALKLTFSAFVITEALEFIEGEEVALDDLSDLAVAVADNALLSTQNFWKAGREPGGLLRAGTWTNRKTFSAAIQKQVKPRYQWAIGAALGFVVSPALWSIGWAAFGWSAVAYAVAEAHNFAKRTYNDYFTVLKATNNPVIYFIDDVLEDIREFVESLMVNPKEALFAARESIDQRFDLDLEYPPFLQQGLLFGAFVGVIAGA
eukprot:scaffold3234_cov166-Amphora_coffeaeformis.AAC.19